MVLSVGRVLRVKLGSNVVAPDGSSRGCGEGCAVAGSSPGALGMECLWLAEPCSWWKCWWHRSVRVTQYEPSRSEGGDGKERL